MNPRTVFHRFSARGFTVVEMLTVVSIIAILACLATMSLSQVRQRTRVAQSFNNLRTCGMSVLLYASENNNRLPPGSADNCSPPQWNSYIAPYLPPPVKMPAGWCTTSATTQSSPLMSPLVPFGQHHFISDYGCNTDVLGIGKSLLLSQISTPSRLVMIASASPTTATMKGGCWYINVNRYINGNGDAASTLLSDWGTGQYQIFFVDGHMEAVDPGTFRANWRQYLLINP